MTNNETKTGLEKYEMFLINNGYPLCISELDNHNKKMLELLTEERATMAKTPISCDKGLLEELKNWTQKEWKYNGAINCDIEYGFSVAQNQVFEILNRYLPQLSPKQEDK